MRHTVAHVAACALIMALACAIFFPAAGTARAQPPTAVPRVLVERFQVTGGSVFSAEELRALVADGEGREFTLAEIETLALRITTHYRRHGYILARAYVPPQEMRDGVVAIAVLEGRIGAIETRDARRYRPHDLAAYLPAGGTVFSEGAHERGLLILNDLPGLDVKSTLKPGEAVGTTDILLDVEKERWLSANVEANNYGSRLTGRERFGVAANLNNPLTLGDVLSFRGMVSRQGEDLWFTRAGYTLPLGRTGTKASITYTHIAVQVGGGFRDLGIAGGGDVLGLSLTHPVLRSRSLNLYGHAAFDYKNFETTSNLGLLNRDRLRVLSAGGAFDTIDLWRGANRAALTLSQGIGGFLDGLKDDDDPRASRPGSGGEFTKIGGEISRLQQITGPTSVFLRASGQWANNRVVSAEQVTVGGIGTVRGYPIGEVAGDHGYATTVEFRWNAPGFSSVPAFMGWTWGDVLQAFAFVDHGRVQVIDPVEGEKRRAWLTGAGAGLQFLVPDNFFLRVEYARPIRRLVDGPKPSDGLDNLIYFQAVKFFEF
jgi:hemolysin activation/secretion protein